MNLTMDGVDQRYEVVQVAIDHALPVLPPFDFTLYMLLLRLTDFVGGEARIGKRTIGSLLGKGPRASESNYQHITEKIQNLSNSGFLSIGDRTREGTRYVVHLPDDVPAVREHKALAAPEADERDYFTDPQLRLELFQRDDFRCHYCGEHVTSSTATLDHFIPQHAGGPNTQDNLWTACLTCNSIKSGRTFAEAAPQILDAVAARRSSASSDRPSMPE